MNTVKCIFCNREVKIYTASNSCECGALVFCNGKSYKEIHNIISNFKCEVCNGHGGKGVVEYIEFGGEHHHWESCKACRGTGKKLIPEDNKQDILAFFN